VHVFDNLTRAGVLLDLSGLAPSSQGARVRFSAGGQRSVIDGPFTGAKELIAGYWVIQVKSREEAIEWAKRIPFEPDPKTGAEPEVELRRLFDAAQQDGKVAMDYVTRVFFGEIAG